MASSKLIPIVYIQWVDAHTNTGWFDNRQAEQWMDQDGLWYSDDVGYLLRETKEMLVFAQRHDPMGEESACKSEQWGALHKIPRTWVKSKRILGYLKSDGTFVPVRTRQWHKQKKR